MEGGNKKLGSRVVGISLQLELCVVGQVQLGPSACQVCAFIGEPRPPKQVREISVA